MKQLVKSVLNSFFKKNFNGLNWEMFFKLCRAFTQATFQPFP